MKRYIISPNLPEGKVCCVAVSSYSREVIEELNVLDIHTIQIENHPRLASYEESHPDLQIHHLGGDKLVAAVNSEEDREERELINKLLQIGIRPIRSNNRIFAKYPHNIALNACRIGNKLLCNPKYTDPTIYEYCEKFNIKIIPVRQGYTKCSVCIVSEHAIITSDTAIAAACKKNQLDILLIRPGYIALPGLNYGFIGGCSGLLSPRLLAFTGNIQLHPDYDMISGFLKNHHVQEICLTNQMLLDIGSIIPLMEII